jgi:hypothetical protein
MSAPKFKVESADLLSKINLGRGQRGRRVVGGAWVERDRGKVGERDNDAHKS